MSKVFKTILFVCFISFTEGVIAQARFKAAVLAGINLSQIDGDKQEGYNKSGVSLGLNGSIFINPAFDISTELLYNEKGARPKGSRSDPNLFYSTFFYQYSEVALLANWYLRPNAGKTYYTRSVHLGFSYGRLLKSSTSIIKQNIRVPELETAIINKYNPEDVSFIIGWSQLFTQRMGITIRHTTSLNALYRNPDYDSNTNNNGFNYLKPYFFSAHLFYNFISPNKVMGLKVKSKKGNKNPLEELN